jgi:hypothetical protein
MIASASGTLFILISWRTHRWGYIVMHDYKSLAFPHTPERDAD